MNPTLTKAYYFRSFFRFKKFGKNILLSTKGKFIRPNEIVFGNNIFINCCFHISARNLNFGSNIMIGPGLVIESDNHVFHHVGSTMFKNRLERNIGFVSIEDDVWIGANVIILPNVIIREGCIVGAGSVITKSLPPYTICVGNPCKPIKSRFSLENMKIHLENIGKFNYNIEEISEQWKSFNV
jgi:acetyltransferase-like isoleucine patch superfamily enzyme